MKQYIAILLLITLLCIALSRQGYASDVVAQQTERLNNHFPIFKDTSIKLLSEYYANSSDFTRRSAGVEFGFSAPAGLHLETGYTLSGFSQEGFEDIMRHSLFIQGEKTVSGGITALIRLSGDFYDNDNSNLNGGLFMRYRSTELSAELSYRHFDIIDTVLPFNNAIYSYVVTIGSLYRDIHSDDCKLYLLYYPVSEVSFAGEFVYGSYSDGNKKRSAMFEAGYQLPVAPYLRAAYNYFYLDINDPAPLVRSGGTGETAYWDPANFETHTVRLELRRDQSDRLSWGAEAALSYSPKSSGLSKSLFLSASYKLMEQASLQFDARWFDQNKGIDRLGETGGFRAVNYGIVFQYSF